MTTTFQNKGPEKNDPEVEPVKPVKPFTPDPEIIPEPNPNRPEKNPDPEVHPVITPEINPGKTDLG